MWIGAFFSCLLISACEVEQDTLFIEMEGKKAGIEFINAVVQNDVYNILTVEHLFNGGGVAIDDFNNDGRLDIVMGYYNGGAMISSMAISENTNSSQAKLTASPVVPTRAVRPTRCT